MRIAIATLFLIGASTTNIALAQEGGAQGPPHAPVIRPPHSVHVAKPPSPSTTSPKLSASSER
jgi:hypothetical protein